MMKSLPILRLTISFIIIPLYIVSCQFIPIPGDDIEDERVEKSALNNINTIYIQSFTGDNINIFQQKFLESLKTIKKFDITELLPDNLENLGVLRIRVEDFTIWENEEKINPFTDLGEFDVSGDTRFIRRNALVNVHISLYEASEGNILIQKMFAQPLSTKSMP